MAAPWTKIKADYLAGKSYQQLADKYGVSLKTIQNRCSNEGWKNELGKIREEAGKAMRGRIVRAHVEQLERLIAANEKLIDGLVQIAEEVKAAPAEKLFDKGGTLRNAESLSRAIQTAVQTQRDLYGLPTLDQNLAKKKESQRKREAKEKLAMEREKWEAEKNEKAKAGDASGTVWEVVQPEDEVEIDG